MMTILKAIILGIIQGLTEFLPVSSSGHLAIAQHFMGVPSDIILFYTAILHLGTLIAVLTIYWKDVVMLIKECLGMCWDLVKHKSLKLNNDYRRLGLYIIIATLPAVVVGLVLKETIEKFFGSQLVIGSALILTGTLLWLANGIKGRTKTIKSMTGSNGFVVGCFQALATIPGVSRSGSTIASGLFLGFNRDFVAKLSFLMSIPVIIGAFITEVQDLDLLEQYHITGAVILTGIMTAALCGFIAIKTLISFLRKDKLHYFAIYTWLLGSSIIIYNIMKG